MVFWVFLCGFVVLFLYMCVHSVAASSVTAGMFRRSPCSLLHLSHMHLLYTGGIFMEYNSCCSFLGLYGFFTCGYVAMRVLQYWIYTNVNQYVFDFLQWKVDETLFYVAHMLLVLVQIRYTYMWYTYYECGYLVCMGCMCCGCFYVG
jgi:hypothetical protein